MSLGKRKRTSRSATEKMRIVLKGMEPGIDEACCAAKRGSALRSITHGRSSWYPVPMRSLEESENGR
jgi:hypothetical protein